MELNIAPQDFQPQIEVLKVGETFLTTLPTGEVTLNPLSSLGLFYQDTRYLSGLEIRIQGQEPIFLSATTRESHFMQVELTNREMNSPSGSFLALETIHLRLLRVLGEGLYQRLRVVSYHHEAIDLQLTLRLAADFRDTFEVRGTKRRHRGTLRQPEVNPGEVVFRYLGLDDIERQTRVLFSPQPTKIEVMGDVAQATFTLHLEPQEKRYLLMGVFPQGLGAPQASEDNDDLAVSFAQESLAQARRFVAWRRECTVIESDNTVFNRAISQAASDLGALITKYPGQGAVVQAGIPWYAAPFGRDALVTSFETLSLSPALAASSLRFLARYQGRQQTPFREEAPGKILHELRRGEMANNGETPHSPYYGSVDATPLFIVLLSEYYRWTGDTTLLEELWPALEAALRWCRLYGDLDGDGFLEYPGVASETGLTNQGWKDSWDGVLDREARTVSGPVALVEVQAYYYLALERAAELYDERRLTTEASNLRQRAQELQEKFLEAFWLEGEGYLAFALDGSKKPLTTTVSNAGQTLFTGILPPERAGLVAKRLLQPDLYSTWGIRTMSKKERAYNPMSYHNGSVWPHDNALIAAGLRRYGYLAELEQVFGGLYQAAHYFPYNRLPELFCGFTYRPNTGPVRYPVACDPQAWATGSWFLLLQSCLGLSCSTKGLLIKKPVLPSWLNELELKGLSARGGRVDLAFYRHQGRTYCSIQQQEGAVKVAIEV